MEDSWDDDVDSYSYQQDTYDYDSYGDSWDEYLPEDEDSWD